MRSATESSVSRCFFANCKSCGLRAMVPSGFITSQITPAGKRPASLAKSPEPSVWPVRTSTPPSRARDGGVLVRTGQTEGSGDLARLAGLFPAGVICEVMNPDGTMARRPQLLQFAKKHRLTLLSVADLIRYRLRHEALVRRVSTRTLRRADAG